MSYDLGQFISIRRMWKTSWVKVQWPDRPTEKVLEQSWFVEVPVNCDECSYWHNEFEAPTREGLISLLREYKDDEAKRIDAIIQRVEVLDEIGEPDEYLKAQVAKGTDDE